MDAKHQAEKAPGHFVHPGVSFVGATLSSSLLILAGASLEWIDESGWYWVITSLALAGSIVVGWRSRVEIIQLFRRQPPDDPNKLY